MTLNEVISAIREQCARVPDARAMSQAGARRLTYAELGTELDTLTAGLQAAGLRVGDAVVFSIRPSVEAVLLLIATVRCGGVVVAADPGVSRERFAAQMSLLAPKWVMAESILYTAARLRVVRAALERRGISLPNVDMPGARRVLVGTRAPWMWDTVTYRDLGRFASTPDDAQLDSSAAAMVVFTSGTTSAPRGVVHSGQSIGAGIGLVAEQIDLGAADRVYSDQMHMIVPALMAGAEAVLPRRRNDPAQSVRDIAACRPTHAYWVPVQLQELMSAAPAALPDSLRVVVLGSAPAAQDFLQRCRNLLPRSARVYSAYAMTEMLPVSWVDVDTKLAYKGPGDLVGEPCRGVHVRFAADGEVLVSGPNLCSGYLGEPRADEIATGDLGLLDGESLVLLGRKKDMIIRGSHNIYPELIEGTIAGIPGVRRCAIVGLYDGAKADETIVLALEPQEGIDPDELRRRVRWEIFDGPRRIDLQARPDHIVITEIPLGGRSRKVDKAALREVMAEMIR